MTSRYDYSALQVNGSIPSQVRLNGNPIYRLQINGVDTIHKYNEEDFDVRPKISIDSFSRTVEIYDFSDETTADGTFYFPKPDATHHYSTLKVEFETDASVSSISWSIPGWYTAGIEGTYTHPEGGDIPMQGDPQWDKDNKTIEISFASAPTMAIFGKYCNGSVTGTLKIPELQITAVVEGHTYNWTIESQRMSFSGTMPTVNSTENTMTLTFTPIYGDWVSVHTSELEY